MDRKEKQMQQKSSGPLWDLEKMPKWETQKHMKGEDD